VSASREKCCAPPEVRWRRGKWVNYKSAARGVVCTRGHTNDDVRARACDVERSGAMCV
jgi:hypothetical protein